MEHDTAPLTLEYEEPDEPNQDSKSRAQLFEPIVRRVVDALGGVEAPSNVYKPGDSASSCLSDLKKLWRRDEDDDERTIARIFFSTLVLPNDLVPMLLVTAGQGMVEDPRAIKCADLICAMTWPIDIAEELKELDEEDSTPEYTQLLTSHLMYKAALLKPGVLMALLHIALPPLARSQKERTPRDAQIVAVILYIIRNLAFIKDPPENMHLSADRAELANMQGRLVRALDETHILELLLTITANEEKDKMLEGLNVIVLEILYLLFRGVRPADLVADQTQQPRETLHRLLAEENKLHQNIARQASSRHSRFGTTISVFLKPGPSSSVTTEGTPSSSSSNQRLVLHNQQAIKADSGAIIDMVKKAKTRKVGGREAPELSRTDNLGIDARRALQTSAREFIKSCFNPFCEGLLKDIRSERAKITEKDNLRLLFVSKWFLEFFLASRQAKTSNESDVLTFGMVAEVTDRNWVIWILKRMRQAVEDKPKQWTELQAGIECLTQLLLLIDEMSNAGVSADADESALSLAEAANTLRQQLIYNGEVLDLAFESLHGYREGTQSLSYLDASVNLAWAVIRGVEKSGKNEMYVRKRRTKKKKTAEGDANADGEEEEEQKSEEEVINETMFSFESFQLRFANSEVTRSLLAYLSRYKEFKSPECMKRVVNLLHRQAVKAKAEGLFFQVSTLNLFKSILADQKNLPRDQPYKDLVKLITFILRQFFKALEEDPFLAIEAFFPKNRSRWKAHSSYAPEDKIRQPKTAEDSRFPPDVQIKKGFSWSEQVGIAIQVLMDKNQKELIDWAIEILDFVRDQRQRLIDEENAWKDAERAEAADPDAEPDAESDAQAVLAGPPPEAIAKFKDYTVPYLSEERAEAATKNPHLKLLFRLLNFSVKDQDAEELEWYIPAAMVPRELQTSLNVIKHFLETPIDLSAHGDKTAVQLTRKKARRRRRAPRSLSDDDDDDNGDGDSDNGAADFDPEQGERRSRSKSSNKDRRQRRVRRQAGEEDRASDEDSDEEAPERKKRRQRRKKEVQEYKSAQFIEDSDEELGNLELFLENEARLRAKTAAAALAGGHGTGTRVGGTKKRKKTGGDDKKRKKRARGASEQESDDGHVESTKQTPQPESDSGSDSDDKDETKSTDEEELTPEEQDLVPSKPRATARPVTSRRAILSDEDDD